MPSLRSATLIEPSQALASAFDRLFRHPAPTSYPVLWGNSDVLDVAFDSTHLQQAVRGLDVSLINCSHEQLGEDLGVFDLVTCLNVLDNCTAPLALVETLKRHTALGGILALSCTYQWSKKYLGTMSERANRTLEPAAEAPTRHIHSLFGAEWTWLNDTNIQFTLRKSERHWFLFLSHVSVFRKNS